jgi:DNA polymerase III epsilon subunit family exonuclease
VQLALDSLDRLVELVEERGGRVLGSEAAAYLFAMRRAPEGLARSLLGPLVDQDSRLAWRGQFVALAESASPALADARFVVFDLETTGLAAASARICEIGAARVERLEVTETLETLVSPGVPLPEPIGRLTGLSDEVLRHAPRIATAMGRFMEFAGDDVLVAHNARFDVGFVNRELERLTGKRLAATVIDTVPLARNLLRGRVKRMNLVSLAFFFGVSTTPCHRALPDALATAEVLIRLIGLAQERGAATVAELEELAAPKPRRIYGKRGLVRDAPTRPGVYLFRDSHGKVLYVGKARDLRARLRSYFQSERQRPAVETALEAADRIEWRIAGSELAAALEEIKLIRELRPAANARKPQPERYVYLRRRDNEVVVSRLPSAYGPLRKRSHAERAARALGECPEDEYDQLLEGAPLVRLYEKLADLADCLRYEEAARLRDRITSLEHVIDHLRRLDELRQIKTCILAPALDPGCADILLVWGGRIVARETVSHATSRAAIDALLMHATDAETGPPSHEPDHLDELLIIGTFVRRPPPELRLLPLNGTQILASLISLPLNQTQPPSPTAQLR